MTTSELPAARLLIVDDDPTNALLLRRVVEREGLGAVAVARDGADALDQIRSWLPDLLILDLNIPVLDGFEVLARLTETTAEDRPAVIIVSGDADPATRQRALDLGAKEFIIKPFERADLVRRLTNLLTARGSRTSNR